MHSDYRAMVDFVISPQPKRTREGANGWMADLLGSTLDLKCNAKKSVRDFGRRNHWNFDGDFKAISAVAVW